MITRISGQTLSKLNAQVTCCLIKGKPRGKPTLSIHWVLIQVIWLNSLGLLLQ